MSYCAGFTTFEDAQNALDSKADICHEYQSSQYPFGDDWYFNFTQNDQRVTKIKNYLIEYYSDFMAGDNNWMGEDVAYFESLSKMDL